jgi:hypothetical protein
VLTFSDLRMGARLIQSSLEPGADIRVRAVLTEYGQPVHSRASVRTAITRPDGTTLLLGHTEIEPGVFEAAFSATVPGTYQCRILAHGSTFRGARFTREQALTGAVYRGGDGPPPHGGPPVDPGREAWCRLFHCLLNDDQMAALLARHGLDTKRLMHCLKDFCDGPPLTEAAQAEPTAEEIQGLLQHPAVLDMIRTLRKDGQP